MKPISEILARYKSTYAASKANHVSASHLQRLSSIGAWVEKDGTVWIKSPTVLSDLKINEAMEGK